MTRTFVNEIGGASARSFLNEPGIFVNGGGDGGGSGPISGFTADRVMVSNASGYLANSVITTTELGFLSGVSSSIQTQLNARVTTGSVATLSVGTAAAPGVTFTGRTNTGMWSPLTNVVGFSTSGAERVRIDATGNVGIGISAPTAPLHVVGNIRGTTLFGNLAGFAASRALASDATGNAVVSAVTAAELANIAGLTSPVQAQLNTKYQAGNTIVANAGIANIPGFTFTGRTTDTGIFSPASNVIAFSTSGTEDMRVDALGNVGIRTAAPQATLHVVGNIIGNALAVDSLTATAANLVIEDIAVGTANVMLGTDTDGLLRSTAFGISANADAMYAPTGSASLPSLAFSGNVSTGLFLPAANILAASTNGSERVRVTATGNVGIGTTAPTDPLHVVGNVRGTTLLGNLDASYLRGSLAADFVLTGGGTFAANGGATAVSPSFTFDTDTQSGLFLPSTGNVGVATAGVERARVDTAGNLTITGTLFQSPAPSVVPATNGQLAFEVTNNTTVTLKLRGTDGIVRSVAFTVA